MNLKEAYRYANFLDSLLNAAYTHLGSHGYIVNIEQLHLKSKVNKDAEDEVVKVKKSIEAPYDAMAVINAVVKIFAEREQLVKAISDAKSGAAINIDNAISMNKKKHEFVEVLKRMADLKSSKEIKQGVGFRFNVNNEQVRYMYDIEETTTIDFDRKDVKGLIKKYLKEADEVSAKLDNIEITTEVSFEPKWDVNDSFEDVMMGEI